ncbi:HNH endonuclease [Dysgonomonas alginatilytica]|uniref:HNH endonuclease n=1 Tax=Dysgonomonas alginatilytica TaxID=1605892 RepID=A0A2V3PMB0_9BACT|nr:HNH endonuclease [Dysgonomonas alginatilytica]PXV62627.1 HNH endonuclease [Dysgonomonas alginatilytica]
MTTIKSNIPGFDNYYVTLDGKVFNLNTGKYLKPQKHPRGYLRVCLYADLKPKMESIHRIVAKAYLSNPNNLPCVMHLDDNPKNNHVSNLRWATHQENMADRDSKDRQAKGELHGHYGKYGEKHNASKLSDTERKEICKKYSTGNYRYRELSAEYGVSQRQIGNIVKTF